jgi:glycosyltransferase involved in cell wall biosynthesis
MNTWSDSSSTNRPAQATRVLERYGEPGGPAERLVTVCVSLFNYAKFLPECLESIRAQRHVPIDLVVVDDASNRDDSLRVAQEWMERNHSAFHRTLLLSHARNQGLAETRNTGFANALSDYVFVIDADNEIYPRAISRLYDALVGGGGFSAAYTQLEFFGDQRKLGVADVWSRDKFALGNYVDAMALVRKDAWRAVGGYTHLNGGWEDYDFWCKLIDAGLEAAYVPEILCRYRVHGASMLRTETLVHYCSRLIVQMTIRHPWLTLKA